MITKIQNRGCSTNFHEWCVITSLPGRVMKIICQYTNNYSRNGLTAAEKLQKQTELARKADITAKKGIESINDICLVSPTAPFILSVVHATHIQQMKKEYTTAQKFKNMGVALTRGSKPTMEDSFCIKQFFIGQTIVNFYAIFDGHGDNQRCGHFISRFIHIKLIRFLHKKELNDENITNALTASFTSLSAQYIKIYGKNAGGTTVVSLLRIGKKHYFSNIGDSRVIRYNASKNTVRQLSEDANVNVPRFKKYHEARGHTVIDDRILNPRNPRLGINMARDVGTFFLCSRPKITYMERDETTSFQSEEYLILASDGLWDVASSKEVAASISCMKELDLDIELMAMNLVISARANSFYKGHEYSDNTIVMIIKV